MDVQKGRRSPSRGRTQHWLGRQGRAERERRDVSSIGSISNPADLTNPTDNGGIVIPGLKIALGSWILFVTSSIIGFKNSLKSSNKHVTFFSLIS